MNCANKALLVLLVVVTLGLWGCAQGPTATAQAERIKSLEAKVARLEADLRTIVSVRDQLRQKLDQSEAQVQKLQTTLKQRIGERDQVAAQYDTFRKSIKELLGEAEAGVLRFPNGEPVTVTVAGPPTK